MKIQKKKWEKESPNYGSQKIYEVPGVWDTQEYI